MLNAGSFHGAVQCKNFIHSHAQSTRSNFVNGFYFYFGLVPGNRQGRSGPVLCISLIMMSRKYKSNVNSKFAAP